MKGVSKERKWCYYITMKRVSNDSNTKIAKGEMDGKGEEELKLAVVGSINIATGFLTREKHFRGMASATFPAAKEPTRQSQWQGLART